MAELNKQHLTETAVNGLAVLGFLALLVIGLWGTVQAVKFVPDLLAAVNASLSSVFVPREELTLTALDGQPHSGDVMTLSWEHRNKETEGAYAFSYACRNGFSFQSSATDGIYRTVPCGTPFSLPDSARSIALIPLSTAGRFVDVPITVSFTPKGSASGIRVEQTLTIVNEQIPAGSGTTGGQTGGGVLTPGPRQDQTFPVTGGSPSNPSGRPDLAVRILAVGTVNRATNAFTETSTLRPGDLAAVRFEIANLGDKTTDQWSFNAVLPTYPTHIFHSPMQQELRPGDKIEFTLRFDQISVISDTGVITVNADPDGRIRNEVSEQNNIRQTTVRIVR